MYTPTSTSHIYMYTYQSRYRILLGHKGIILYANTLHWGTSRKIH